MHEANASCEVVAAGVFAGEREGGGGDVCGRDVRVRQMMCERDGDSAGAGADVENARLNRLLQFIEHGFDEVLSFRPGDEDGGRDAEGEAEELLLAGDVLDGLVLQAAADGGLIGGRLFGRDGAVGIGVELRASDTERVKEQRERVAGSGIAQIGRGGQLDRSAVEDGRGSWQLAVLRLDVG